MKIKPDENLPTVLVQMLEGVGHQVATAVDQGLGGVADSTIWAAVQSEGRFLITLDLDFSDVRQYPPGSHSVILLLRPRHTGRIAVAALVAAVLEREDLNGMSGSLVVADEHHTRIRRVAIEA